MCVCGCLVSLEIFRRLTAPSCLFQWPLILAEQMWKLPALVLDKKGDAGKQLSEAMIREKSFHMLPMYAKQ